MLENHPLGAVAEVSDQVPPWAWRPAMPAACADIDEADPIDLAAWSVMALDEIDYGILCLAETGAVLHANRAALAVLARGAALTMFDGGLRPRCGADASAWRTALHDAGVRQRRTLVTLGSQGGDTITAALVPMRGAQVFRAKTLVILSKAKVCEDLSLQCFAARLDLTLAEAQVLSGLCVGLSPADVAAQKGVAISTVRTQILSIRAKTGTDSISALIRQLALLPPLVGRLAGRCGLRGAANA